MKPSFDKDDKKQYGALKQEEPKDRKHEGARETRPERPETNANAQPLQREVHKRDEEQDKKVPEKRDDEQPKVLTGKPAKAGHKPDDAAKHGKGNEAPDMAETESGNVEKTEPEGDEAPSQGI
ncbi:MAG: hypothetical protein AABY18_09495 [Candidatus Thermoplasmatota archaeon]